jgi:hypothetical protein
MGDAKMSQVRKTPEGMIDYDFHKKKAARLRRVARNRAVAFVVGTISVPFRQMARLARRWQATWPSPPVGIRPGLGLPLAKVRSLFW